MFNWNAKHTENEKYLISFNVLMQKKTFYMRYVGRSYLVSLYYLQKASAIKNYIFYVQLQYSVLFDWKFILFKKSNISVH